VRPEPELLVPDPLVPEPPDVEPDPELGAVTGDVTVVTDPPSLDPEPDPDLSLVNSVSVRPPTPSVPALTASSDPLAPLGPDRSPECWITVLGESSLPDGVGPEPDGSRSPSPEWRPSPELPSSEPPDPERP
jgi:hypothetical protein